MVGGGGGVSSGQAGSAGPVFITVIHTQGH